MFEWTITRWGFPSELTLGESRIGDKIIYWAENPWKDNARSISCIPPGRYKVIPREPSEKFPYKHLHVLDVPHRSYILVHKGNSDEHTEGCLLPGEDYGGLGDLGHGVLRSTEAFNWLMAHPQIGQRPTILHIRVRFPYAVQ